MTASQFNWLERRPFQLAILILATVPFWFAAIPPLIDFPGHLARYYISMELAHSPYLQANWDYKWQLTANLGVDLLVIPLAKIFGIERAGWIAVTAIPAVMIWGMLRVSKATHGRVTPLAMAAVPFAFSYPFTYGFVNYWLGVALAFHGYATWLDLDRRNASPRTRALIFGPASCLLWVVHLYGWAILGVLAGAAELCRAWDADWRRWPAMCSALLRRLWPLMVPLPLMLVWRQNSAGAATHGFFDFDRKLTGMVQVLRDQVIMLDTGVLLFALAVIALAAVPRMFVMERRLGVAAGLFMLLLLVMPFWLFGLAHADLRLWPVALIAALLALAPAEGSNRFAGSVVASAALMAFVLKIAAMSAGFAHYDREYRSHLKALDSVERGAAIAVLVAQPCTSDWRENRLDQLGSIAILRRDAFVNSQWAIGGAQLLHPLKAAGTAFNADPSQLVEQYADCSKPMDEYLAKQLDKIPRTVFDYIWVIDFDVARLPPYEGLTRVYADGTTALYRLDHKTRRAAALVVE